MYRAHLTVYGSDDRRMSRRAIERDAPFLVRNIGHLGTRQGIDGIWVEAQTVSLFRDLIHRAARMAIETGYGVRFGATNHPSFETAGAIVEGYRRNGESARNLLRVGRA